ncbi:hypothetical protein KW797_01385 [Candidatus Parcubacteria bacterium]|nr:hypothetical protein [Candidatus Parcubacteria bacterium]
MTMTVATIPKQTCLRCGKESGTRIVCELCRVELTPSQRKRMDHTYQLMVIELFDRKCVDCDLSAEPTSGELCADHVDTKGASPEARYDLADGVCRCASCHNKRGSGEIAKVPPKHKMPKQTQERTAKSKKEKCAYFTCNLQPMPGHKKGYCYIHRDK